jgi:hypothetical protein
VRRISPTRFKSEKEGDVQMNRLARFILISALVVVVSFCSDSNKTSQDIILRDLLPQGSALGVWTEDGELQEFKGDDLYIYINGGAEIYLEYGFKSVLVRDYSDDEGHSVSLEVFEMTDPASAYGMYTFKISGNGRIINLGDGGELESYYLNFWKGSYLVTLTGFDDKPETIGGLQTIGRAVAAGIPGRAEKPSLAELAAELGYEKIRYIEGFLGLNSVYSFHTARGLSFDEGVKGVGADGAMLLILNYGTRDEGLKSFEELREYLVKSERFTGTELTGNDFVSTTDDRTRPLCLSHSGRYLLVSIGADKKDVPSLFDSVRSRLTERSNSDFY